MGPVHAVSCERSQPTDNEEGCYREDWDNEERGYETINRYYQRCCVKPREVDSDSLQTRSSCRLLQASSVENAETKSCHPSENIDPAAQPCIPGQHQTAPDQHNERDPKLGKHQVVRLNRGEIGCCRQIVTEECPTDGEKAGEHSETTG